MVKHIRKWSEGQPLLDETDWNDMTEVLQDKDLSHNHKGGEDEGIQIDHADLINVTESQHHPTNKSARVYNSVYQSIPKTTFVLLNNDSEDWDTDNIHDNVTNNTRLTCKTAGKYLIIGEASWYPNTAADLVLNIWYNNSTTRGASSMRAPSGYVSQQVMSLMDLAVNDYVELRVWHNATASINCRSAMFAMIRVA